MYRVSRIEPLGSDRVDARASGTPTCSCRTLTRSAMLVHEQRLPCVTSRAGSGRSHRSIAVGVLARRSLPPSCADPAGRRGGHRRAWPCTSSTRPMRMESCRQSSSGSRLPRLIPLDSSPQGLVPDVEKWLAIARGAPVPEQRPPWARPGWLAAATAWMEESVAGAGLRQTGRSRSWSSGRSRPFSAARRTGARLHQGRLLGVPSRACTD